MGVDGRAALTYILARYRNPNPPNPPRTLQGADAVRQLRDGMRPENRNFNQQVLDDRLSQGLPAGPEPPHETPTSNQTWYGDSGQRANFGPNPTRRQIADSHAFLHDDGQSGECLHHFIGRDGAVGAASTQACADHVRGINKGWSRVPAEHQDAVRAHLTRHLRDGNVAVPQPAVPRPLSGRSAQQLVEELRIAEETFDRREHLADLEARDRYFEVRQKRV